MANPAVTYIFANSTTADASQVNQNFTDLINGMTDGTKDLSINALTCAGTATLNGAINLGNATADDITVTGSLASSIPIKTNVTYDIGSSTLGLASVYYGTTSSRTARLVAPALAASTTVTLPNITGTLALAQDSAGEITNLALAATVAASAMTVALKTKAGTDAATTDIVKIGFRNATAATGTYVQRTVTGALSIVIPSTATMGSTNANPNWVYVYAIDNAGTVELAVSASKNWDEGSVQTTTATPANSKTTLYSTTARTGVAVRLIGRVLSTQATAGTWASAPTEIAVFPFEQRVQRSEVYDDTGAGHGSSSTKIRRIETNRKNVGTAITKAYSATLGNTYTINEDGIYSVMFIDLDAGAASFVGISVNSSTLTTAIASVSYAQGKRAISRAGSTGTENQASWIGFLAAGDIVRPHTDGATSNTTDNVIFSIVKISD